MGLSFTHNTHRIMETTLSKVEKVLINVIEKAANAFITIMAVIFSLLAIVTICTGLDFVNLFGFVGFAGAAWFAWSIRR